MFDLRVEIFGDVVISRRFTRFAENASDQTDTMREVARVLGRATAENFATDGRSGGHPWAPLAASTVARKRRLRLDPRILRATERLYHSLVPAADEHGARSTRTGRFAPGGKDHVENVTRDSLEWGSTVAYGEFHQSRAPRSRLPRRPPVALNGKVKAEITRTVQRGLMEGVK